MVEQRDGQQAANAHSRSGRAGANHSVFLYFAQPSGARVRPIGCLPLIVPAIVAAVLGALAPSYALPAALVVVAVMWWHRRRMAARPQATFRFEDSLLLVLGPDSRERLRVPLQELLEVELDTKTIQRVQDNLRADVLPHFRLLHGKVGTASDVSRIVLVTATQALPLTEELMSSSYTGESFGQLRRFLRDHGWLPAAARTNA